MASFSFERELSVSKPKKDFDAHGCCLSCGEYFCLSSKTCVTEADHCSHGDYFDEDACTFTHIASEDGTSFKFDLGKYQKPDYYVISDSVTHKKQEYYYYFRLCKAVDTSLLPPECAETVGTAEESCKGQSMAFQYTTTSWKYQACFRLSDCFKDGPDREMGLLNPMDPTAGIYLLYSGGNTCPNSWADKAACYTHASHATHDDDSDDKSDDDHSSNDDDAMTPAYCSRSFRLNINCHNEINEVPLREEVEEAGGCAYEATINHVMGCPVECPRDDNGRVCSARGTCFYDGYDAGSTVDNTQVSLRPLTSPHPSMLTDLCL